MRFEGCICAYYSLKTIAKIAKKSGLKTQMTFRNSTSRDRFAVYWKQFFKVKRAYKNFKGRYTVGFKLFFWPLLHNAETLQQTLFMVLHWSKHVVNIAQILVLRFDWNFMLVLLLIELLMIQFSYLARCWNHIMIIFCNYVVFVYMQYMWDCWQTHE